MRHDLHKQQVIARGRRDDIGLHLPMAVRLAADLRPSAEDGSTVRTSGGRQRLKLQAASVPIARAAVRLGHLRNGTDRRRDRGIA